MRRVRIIPVLLIQNEGLVKSVQFKKHKYVGDPINAVKIFNDKEVDEIVVLDISATRDKKGPDISRIAEITGEAFMPLAYGGGITTIEQIKDLLFNGVEKVVLNTSALDNLDLIKEASGRFGSQSVVVSIDVQKNWMGQYKVFRDNGQKKTNLNPEELARQVEAAGAGEIFLTSIDRDGTYQGYDVALIKLVSTSVGIPVVACGGAAEVMDFTKVILEGGASAAAAGSMFVFQRPHQAVLISYPTQSELKEKVFKQL